MAKKDGYTVIDYRYVLADSFDEPLRRECRGIKFDEEGVIIARPLHKFFNWGEKPETGLQQVDFGKPHVVMEKMDGSMIHPAFVKDRLVFMTRMGRTDVALEAERLFLEGNDYLRQGLIESLVSGFTPVFEYIGPDNRIVEAYDQPELVLLQARDIANGDYLSLDALQVLSIEYGVRVAPTYPAFSRHEDVLAVHSRAEGGEGVVLVFEDGLFVKIKTDEYRRLHRIKDDVSREHDLARLILDGQIDDALPLFDERTRAQVEAFAGTLMSAYAGLGDCVQTLVTAGQDVDQKTFATVTLKDAPHGVRSCAFSLRKDKTVGAGKVVHDFLIAHTKDAKAFDSVRDMLGGVRFEGKVARMEAGCPC
ncbi:RNA ligase and tail fiber protein attachment catalyst [Caulobacter phage CcrBL9]|uniref:RNA ligase n=1 Tax=Caulobacter phage CcrBL9 TaxID=2283270 RepID=A0A385EC34_9CAUD|nr:RNA ligase and tail fiber protein attachment catalyst [Caulobacter phage CcrBL9]AXQ69246.1 RNA ligase [Caulobacter phage CcrBL9]